MIKSRTAKNYTGTKGIMCEVDFSCELGMAAGGNCAFQSIKKHQPRCFNSCGAVAVKIDEVNYFTFKNTYGGAYDGGVSVVVNAKEFEEFKKGFRNILLLTPGRRDCKILRRGRFGLNKKFRGGMTKYVLVTYLYDVIESKDYFEEENE